MSYAKIASAQAHLLEGKIVTVEVDLSRGLHAFSIVGLPDKAVEEAKDRVSSAIKNSGLESPKSKNHKIVISLSPADLKKEGASFDLAIALGYLLASDAIMFIPEGKLFLGELALSGDILPIRGTLALVEAAKKDGYEEVFVPNANAQEAALVKGITVYGVGTLSEVLTHLNTKPSEGTAVEPGAHATRARLLPTIRNPITLTTIPKTANDLSEIRGQEMAKRGLEIAAAGGHNIAMSGPPGTGKTMLARAFASLLPELSLDEMLEITRIHSIAGILEETLATSQPFRAPHHTASYVSIIGGGSFPRPGEVTLAHRGVLFLDEFPEFDKRVLESLRQPLEDRIVSISRARGSALFPSNFMLVAAMNPCPCGYRGSRMRECTCMPGDLARYARKLSGPILDRIDLWVTVAPVEYNKLLGLEGTGENSDAVRIRIARARSFAQERFKASDRPIRTNSDMKAKDISKYAPLSDDVRKLLNTSAEKLQLSGRAYHRIIKLARTIADLAASTAIQQEHVLEALQYRPKT